MADKKISQLTAATIPLAGTEALPLVQTSTKKIAASDLMKRTFDDFGINTNPSAWSVSFTGVDVGSGGSMMADATSFYQGSNWFWSGAAYIYKNNGTAVQSIYTGTGEYIIANAPSGTAGNAASFTNRLYMYSEGSLGMLTGNLVIGAAGKGITTSVTNGDVTVTPDGTGKTILAKNGLRIPNNAAITVGTGATQISVNAVSWSSLAFVFGVDGGGNAFSDLVFYADGTTVALASRTVSASPTARTYTAPGGQLNLAMGSGSYSVFFQHIWTA